MNLRLTTMAAAAVMLSATVAPAFAADTPPTRIIDENFEYPVGNLYQQGGWVKYGPNAAAPVQVEPGIPGVYRRRDRQPGSPQRYQER